MFPPTSPLPPPCTQWARLASRRARPASGRPSPRALAASSGRGPPASAVRSGPVRKLIKIALVALGIRALLHWRKKRQEARTTTASQADASDDPADELRRKLAESREDDATADEPPAPAAVADRRADVHDQGRVALDEMNASNED
jgi:hypothetical protein